MGLAFCDTDVPLDALFAALRAFTSLLDTKWEPQLTTRDERRESRQKATLIRLISKESTAVTSRADSERSGRVQQYRAYSQDLQREHRYRPCNMFRGCRQTPCTILDSAPKYRKDYALCMSRFPSRHSSKSSSIHQGEREFDTAEFTGSRMTPSWVVDFQENQRRRTTKRSLGTGNGGKRVRTWRRPRAAPCGPLASETASS